ncbi:MAG TPA: arginine--tRNA ligase, partial [Anaerolineae bacterium]|nr:arginine--tRNA ligase [Anaerolineae bacterium]
MGQKHFAIAKYLPEKAVLQLPGRSGGEDFSSFILPPSSFVSTGDPMIRHDIAQLITKALKKAQKKGDLPKFDLPDIILERPKDPTHGDYASPAALGLARYARMAPIKIAESIIKRMERPDYLGEVSAVRPGFINIRLSSTWLAQQVQTIINRGDSFGRIELGQGKRAQVEFISANPTGPLTFGSGRNAVLGDALASVLDAAGFSVQREYYLNDQGNQVDIFARSLQHHYANALGQGDKFPFPENGYPGDYLIEMGRQLVADVGDAYLSLDEAEALRVFRDEGLTRMIARIKADAELLNIHFDNWFSEKSLYDDGVYGKVFNMLSVNNQLVEKDGAIWFKGAEEEAKDNVVVRSDGRPTYFASDIAYIYNKLVMRGFEQAIYVWGADHHGHVARLKAAARALGLDDERITIILYQLVALERDGKPVRMGKRSKFITLAEVVEEIGADATRFMLLTRSADSQMTLDLGLAVKQSNDNPVYYVQYAHARIASILRRAA